MSRFQVGDKAYYISGTELVPVIITQIIKTQDVWLYGCKDSISEVYLREQDLYTMKEK